MISKRLISISRPLASAVRHTSTMFQQPPYPLHETVIKRVDPEYKAFYEKHVAHQQQAHLQPLEISRASGILVPGVASLTAVGKTQDFEFQRVESKGPNVRVRCFTPKGNIPDNGWPALIWYHGGGWVLGNIDTENAVTTDICARGECVVISVDFRLAPENPFPAAVEDAWEAVQWATTYGRDILHLNPLKMAIGGSSAGGNLAIVMSQRAADRGLPKFQLQLLSVPITDNSADVMNNASWAENQHAPALPAEKMIWFRRHYLPNESDWTDPEASPIFWKGDWSKLPPAIMVLGELDILRGEAQDYGKRLKNAGVGADIHILKGQPHPFLAMSGVLKDGQQAVTWFGEAMHRAMYRDD